MIVKMIIFTENSNNSAITSLAFQCDARGFESSVFFRESTAILKYVYNFIGTNTQKL